MSNKPDWKTAPLDAQFYSCHAFRKHEGRREYKWRGVWAETLFDPLEFHRDEMKDFEVRPESSGPEWDGKGLPPAGTVCEAQHKVLSWREPERGEILFMGDDIYVIKTDDGEKARLIDGARFYPIKSERDKWINEAREEFAEFSDTLIGKIYDSLKSGKPPTP